MSDPIVIVSAARTPMGALQGDFASLSAHDLGGVAIKAAVEQAGVSAIFDKPFDPSRVRELVVQVLTSGG